jgi:hypothetical protein
MTRSPTAPLALLATIVLAGCGGGDDSGSEASSSPPTPAPPAATTGTATSRTGSTRTAPEITTTAPTGAVPTTAGTPTSVKPDEPDAGDEEGIRVPASFTLRAGKLSPSTVAVPAFLRIELVVANKDTGGHTVRVQDTRLRVPGGDTASAVIEEGLRKGRFPVTVDGRRAGAIRSGAEGGP